ncbi:MAG: ABC transporter ATP-binding protein [Chloroflexi bacterium]|nr:ABC transporter ATP-binding protein [Chloroflexota bacterium]
MTELLALENITMEFRARTRFLRTVPVRALSDVSLTVAKGETVAVVGESGSGKTTLGRVALRLLKPTAGRVVFDGEDITGLSASRLKRIRRRAQGIFQDPFSSIDPFMSVHQILEEPLIIHGQGDRDARVHKALADVRLTPAEEFVPKFPHMLSGGQRQRVGIARALMLNPDYIVADEPVSMIDASSRVEILSLMRDLQRQYGIAFLYITHDIATARHFSHRIAVMYLGRIVEMGSPEAVVNEPLHPYTRALIAAVPEPDPANRLRQRDVVPGEPPSPARAPSGCRFHPRCPHFMPGLCDVTTPPLLEAQGHLVACHLYTEEGRTRQVRGNSVSGGDPGGPGARRKEGEASGAGNAGE